MTPQKLAFLQKSHAESIASKEDSRADEIVQMITKAVSEHLSAQNLRTDMSVRELSARLFKLEARNYRNAPSFVDRYAHFYLKGVELLPTTSPKETIPEPLLSWMSRFLVDFNEVTDQDWLLENLQRSLLAKGERLAELVHQSAPINGRSKVEPRQLTSYFNRFLRWALTGGRPGPSIINTLILLGPAISRRRLAAAQDFLSY